MQYVKTRQSEVVIRDTLREASQEMQDCILTAVQKEGRRDADGPHAVVMGSSAEQPATPLKACVIASVSRQMVETEGTPKAVFDEERICPPAPRKPRLRGTGAASQTALDIIRDSVDQLDSQQRSSVLSNVPHHTLEALMLAYCDWLSHSSTAAFEDLLHRVPDLDRQVFQQAEAAFPGVNANVWEQQVGLSALDPLLRRQLVDELVGSVAGAASRRVLTF